jgi:hypothetical protein
VEQAVVPSRRTGGDVVTLDKENVQSPEGAVAGRSRSSNSASDDDDVEFVILSVTHMRYSIEFNQQI